MANISKINVNSTEYDLSDKLVRNSLPTKVSKTLNNQTLSMNSEVELYLWSGYSSIVITNASFPTTTKNLSYKLDDGNWIPAYQITTPYTIDVTDVNVIRFKAGGGASYPITLTCDLISDTPLPRPITDTAKGSSITLTDSTDEPINAISIMGKSTQNGTPTIDNPIPIVDITSEEIEITDGTQTQTANLDIVLRGIPVSSGGNYTDNNNQQWLCDTIERYKDGSGKYIQRVETLSYSGSNNYSCLNSNNYPHTDTSIFAVGNAQKGSTLISNCFVNKNNLLNIDSEGCYVSTLYNGTRFRISNSTIGVTVSSTNEECVNALKNYLTNNNVTLEFYSFKATPIETPLTAEQLEELDLDTYYPTTNINSNADVVVEYVADTKKYVDEGLDTKQDKTTITTNSTDTTVSLTLADNNEYRYTQDLTSLTLTMPSGDFISSVVFVSGTTPTQMTYDSNIKWSGDDVTSNAFVPVASKTYNIVFWYDGININAIARGV